MATYTIIGGDGKQYGSVSGEDLRKWISEGRLNAQSFAKADGDVEFRPLAQFPEFADVFGSNETAPPIQPPGGTINRNVALQKIKVPAVGLIVTAVLNIVLSLWSLVQVLFSQPDFQRLNAELDQLHNPQVQQLFQKMMQFAYGPFGIVNDFLGLGMSVLILIGALKMKSLLNYEFAYAAAILAVVPCLTPCCGFVIGLAFGIWALVVLGKPEVKSQFN